MLRALFILPLLSACGGIGLSPAYDDTLSSSAESMADELTGRTYAAWMDEVVAVEPMGLGLALADVEAAAILLHVVDASTDHLTLAITLSDGSGSQSQCEPVQDLPEAGWSDDMAFFIGEGSFDLPVGGKPMTLFDMEMTGQITDEGAAMGLTTLVAEIDTRDLNGGVFGENVDVCIIVEQLGSTCHACPDGAVSCTDLVLELAPVEVDISFETGLSGC